VDASEELSDKSPITILGGDDVDFDYEAFVAPLLVLSSCVSVCVCLRVCRVCVCVFVFVVYVCVTCFSLNRQTTSGINNGSVVGIHPPEFGGC